MSIYQMAKSFSYKLVTIQQNKFSKIMLFVHRQITHCCYWFLETWLTKIVLQVDICILASIIAIADIMLCLLLSGFTTYLHHLGVNQFLGWQRIDLSIIKLFGGVIKVYRVILILYKLRELRSPAIWSVTSPPQISTGCQRVLLPAVLASHGLQYLMRLIWLLLGLISCASIQVYQLIMCYQGSFE